jgi:hypothetical protein
MIDAQFMAKPHCKESSLSFHRLSTTLSLIHKQTQAPLHILFRRHGDIHGTPE